MLFDKLYSPEEIKDRYKPLLNRIDALISRLSALEQLEQELLAQSRPRGEIGAIIQKELDSLSLEKSYIASLITEVGRLPVRREFVANKSIKHKFEIKGPTSPYILFTPHNSLHYESIFHDRILVLSGVSSSLDNTYFAGSDDVNYCQFYLYTLSGMYDLPDTGDVAQTFFTGTLTVHALGFIV